MIRRFTLVVALVTMSIISYGQLDNSFFDWAPKFDANDSGRLGIEVENLNYLRNIEYKTFADEGRTLFGYQLAPQLHYQVSSKVAVRGGIYLKSDFGNSKYRQIAPLFGLTYKNGNHTVNFGNLQGAMMHRLIEPLYDPENIITKRLENGAQYLFNSERIDFDLWLNWQQMIYRNSPFQEKFTAGVSTELDIIKKENFELNGIVQMMARHQGGEIDASPLPPSSRYNFNYGVKLQGKINGWLGLKGWDIQTYLALYKDPSKHVIDTFTNGMGQYFTATLKWEHITVMANYWESHQFEAPAGETMFHSVSRQNPTAYTRDYRTLASLRLFYQIPLSAETEFLFRGMLTRDMTWGTWDYITELYFRWNIFRKLN